MSSTASTATNLASPASSLSSNSFQGADRRRRKRAKISAQLHVRLANGPSPSEEVCTSVDVSRDGLLFTSARSTYAVGQTIEVTFPYSSAASGLNKGEPAEVVRITEQPGNRFAIAVHFAAARQTQHLPSAVPAPTVAKGTSSHTSAQASVVLAVEADPRSGEMMRGVLQQDGYSVTIVSTANEALDFLKSKVPAVFIAEVEAKDMSGQDLCLIVKRNERLQRVPVILLTRSAQPADYAASHQLGAVVCMAKPFKPERLLHVVRLVAPHPAQKNAYARSSNSSIERAF